MQTNLSRSSELPAPVVDYFAHETTDPAALARCFTEDALVVDERHEHRGRAAIAAWNAAANAKYAFATDVLQTRVEGHRVTVQAKVTGTFPGSPVELRFRFTLTGGLIASLEIAA